MKRRAQTVPPVPDLPPDLQAAAEATGRRLLDEESPLVARCRELSRQLKEQVQPDYGFVLLLSEMGEEPRHMSYGSSLERDEGLALLVQMQGSLESSMHGSGPMVLDGQTIGALREGAFKVLESDAGMPEICERTQERLSEARRVIERVAGRPDQLPTDEDIRDMMKQAMLVAMQAVAMYEYAKAGLGVSEADRARSVAERKAEPPIDVKQVFAETALLIETKGLEAALQNLRERGAPASVIEEVRLNFTNYDLRKGAPKRGDLGPTRRGDTKTTLVEDLMLKPPTANREGLVALAKAGAFHDYDSQSATPKVDLINALRAAGYADLMRCAMNGDYDADRPSVVQIEEMRAELGPDFYDAMMGDKSKAGRGNA